MQDMVIYITQNFPYLLEDSPSANFIEIGGNTNIYY